MKNRRSVVCGLAEKALSALQVSSRVNNVELSCEEAVLGLEEFGLSLSHFEVGADAGLVLLSCEVEDGIREVNVAFIALQG
jgi:hypothetical protein